MLVILLNNFPFKLFVNRLLKDLFTDRTFYITKSDDYDNINTEFMRYMLLESLNYISIYHRMHSIAQVPLVQTKA